MRTRDVLTKTLILQHRFAEAETLLNQQLAIDQKKTTETWQHGYSKLLLGESLVGQKKYTRAEPLLLESWQTIQKAQQQVPPAARTSLNKDVLEQLVTLYQHWSKPDQAAAWQKKLDALAKPESQPEPPKKKQPAQ